MPLLHRKPTTHGTLQRTAITRASALEIAVYWWIYRWRYLEAKRIGLEERTQTTAPGGNSPGQARRSQVLMSEVPADDKATFDEHVQRAIRRATHAQQGDPHVDPDQIEHEAITALIAEAEDNGDGWGFVPEAGGKLYDVRPIPTSDPRHQVPPVERKVPVTRLLAALCLVVAAILVMTLTYRSRSRAAIAQAAPAVSAQPGSTPTPLTVQDDDETSALRPTTLEIVRGSTRHTLAVARSESTIGGVWEPTLLPGQAAHLDGTVVNLALCLAPQDRALVVAATAGETITLRIANGETRRYTARAPRTVPRSEREVLDQRMVGLTLIVCGVRGNDRDILQASPQQLAPSVARQPTPTQEREEHHGLRISDR